MFKGLKKFWHSLHMHTGFYRGLSDSFVLASYVEIGKDLGEQIYDRHLGVPAHYHSTLDFLIKLESEISLRGYRSVPILAFSNFPPTVNNISRMQENEIPIYFAKEWRDRYNDEQIFGNFLERAFCSNEPIVETIELEEVSGSVFDHELEMLQARMN